MSAVVAGGILSLIPGLGIVGTVDCLILWWYEWICERFGELPGAVWCVGQPERWQIACYYAGIFLLVFGRKYVEAWKKRGTYGEENVPGDRLHSARTPWCLITRGANESIRNRKRELLQPHKNRARITCKARFLSFLYFQLSYKIFSYCSRTSCGQTLVWTSPICFLRSKNIAIRD